MILVAVYSRKYSDTLVPSSTYSDIWTEYNCSGRTTFTEHHIIIIIRTRENVNISYAHRIGTGNREHGLVRCCYLFFSVTSNKSLSGQSKTLIRLRALCGAGLCAPSFAANAKRPIFACCYFVISSNRWKSLCRMRTGEIQLTVRNKYVNMRKKCTSIIYQ